MTVSPEESVVAAARRMAELGVGDLIVVDAPGDGAARPLGIVTDRDLAIGVLTDTTRTPADVKVDDVMTRELATAGEDDDIETVLSKMRHNATRRLPVIDRRGYLVGIISLDDVVDWMAEQLDVMTALLDRQREIADARLRARKH